MKWCWLLLWPIVALAAGEKEQAETLFKSQSVFPGSGSEITEIGKTVHGLEAYQSSAGEGLRSNEQMFDGYNGNLKPNEYDPIEQSLKIQSTQQSKSSSGLSEGGALTESELQAFYDKGGFKLNATDEVFQGYNALENVSQENETRDSALTVGASHDIEPSVLTRGRSRKESNNKYVTCIEAAIPKKEVETVEYIVKVENKGLQEQTINVYVKTKINYHGAFTISLQDGSFSLKNHDLYAFFTNKGYWGNTWHSLIQSEGTNFSVSVDNPIDGRIVEDLTLISAESWNFSGASNAGVNTIYRDFYFNDGIFKNKSSNSWNYQLIHNPSSYSVFGGYPTQMNAYQFLTHGALERPSSLNNYQFSDTVFRSFSGGSVLNSPAGFRYQFKAEIESPPEINFEGWVGDRFSSLISKGTCEVAEETCIEGAETRTFGLGRLKKQVYKPCWKKQRTLYCGGGSTRNDCQSLEAQGCSQVASKLAKVQDGYPVEYEQTFLCQSSGYRQMDKLPEIDENEYTQGLPDVYDAFSVDDFTQALMSFEVLKGMNDDMQDGLGGIRGSSENPTIFHGKPERCSIRGADFIQNCCNLKGVLNGILAGGCKNEIKLANAMLKDKRCHLVEKKYCTKRIKYGLGSICVSWKDAYCCYGNKLSKIIHEIAKDDPDQLNLREYNRSQSIAQGWGNGENPNCASLSAEQIKRMSFNTPYAQQHLAQLLEEYAEKAKEKIKIMQERTNSSQGGFKANAKAAGAKMTQHYSHKRFSGRPTKED